MPSSSTPAVSGLELDSQPDISAIAPSSGGSHRSVSAPPSPKPSSSKDTAGAAINDKRHVTLRKRRQKNQQQPTPQSEESDHRDCDWESDREKKLYCPTTYKPVQKKKNKKKGGEKE